MTETMTYGQARCLRDEISFTHVTLPKGKWSFKLTHSFSMIYNGYKFHKPVGWLFDMASSPRWLWWFISPLDLGVVGVFIHDVITEHQGHLDGLYIDACDSISDKRISKKDCDQMFLQVMLAEKVPPFKAYCAYYTIRLLKPVWDDKTIWSKND